jgi:hypothetical protein
MISPIAKSVVCPITSFPAHFASVSECATGVVAPRAGVLPCGFGHGQRLRSGGESVACGFQFAGRCLVYVQGGGVLGVQIGQLLEHGGRRDRLVSDEGQVTGAGGG